MSMTSHTGQEPPVLDVRNRPVFESFYHREFPAIRAVVWALTGNVWTAEEVAQDGTPLAPIAVETPWLWPAGGKLYRMPMDGQLAELDPVTLAPVHTYTVPKHEDGDPALVADDSGHLYYRPDYMKLYRIDTASGAVDEFLQLPWEETPTGLAWGFGSLWITNFEDDNVWRVNTSL